MNVYLKTKAKFQSKKKTKKPAQI